VVDVVDCACSSLYHTHGTTFLSSLIEHLSSNTIIKHKQDVPTSAYLICLAAGDLEARDISDRVKIWSEPSVVDRAHFDFSQTEDFVKAAEIITDCPYAWGRYVLSRADVARTSQVMAISSCSGVEIYPPPKLCVILRSHVRTLPHH